jgi:hypothetical protein
VAVPISTDFLQLGTHIESTWLNTFFTSPRSSSIDRPFSLQFPLFSFVISSIPHTLPHQNISQSCHVSLIQTRMLISTVRFLDLVSPFQKWLPEIISPERKVRISLAIVGIKLTVQIGAVSAACDMDCGHATYLPCLVTSSTLRNCVCRFG